MREAQVGITLLPTLKQSPAIVMESPNGEQSPLAAAIAALPSCALACIQAAMANSTCSPLDNACRCTNAAYNAQVSQCVLGSCTIREGLTTRNITAGICGVEPYVDHSAKGIFIAFTALTTIFVGLRFLARQARNVHVWWDDVMSFVGVASVIALLGIMMNLYEIGMGSDMWSIKHENITRIFLLMWVAMFLYGVARTVSRVSIMLFYFRIFENTPGRRLRIAVLVLDVLSCSALILLVLFPCRPISHFWDRWDGEHEGTCLDFYGEAVGIGIKDIIVDVIIITLPLPWISKLNLNRKKKIMSCILFSVGLCVIIVSAGRIAVVDKFVHSTNPTVDMMDLAILSVVELSLGIICACLPSVKPLLNSQYVPFLKSTRATKDSATPKYYPEFRSGNSGQSGGTSQKKIRVTYSTAATDSNNADRDESPLVMHPHGPYVQLENMESRVGTPRTMNDGRHHQDLGVMPPRGAYMA